jgi:ectoine hydroxylase-related dioxygenase (phytanoyl-CoA dioxygenase family)
MATAQAVSALTEEELYYFEANGFLVVPRALSETEVARVLGEFGTIEEHAVQYGYEHQGDDLLVAAGHLQAIPNPMSRLPIVLDITLHPAFFPKIHSLLFGQTRLLSNEYFVTPAGSAPRISWHRDLEEENHPTLPLGDALLTIVDNGPTLALPGSHRWKRGREIASEWRGTSHPEGFPGNIPLCAPRGSAVFFDSRLYHSQSANASSVDRRAVVLVYGQRWMREFDGYVPTGDAADALARNAFERQFLGLTPGYYSSPEDYIAPDIWRRVTT